MKRASQIIVYVATLLGVVFVGSFFCSAFWQMEFYAERLLDGKPLPYVTQFFVNNNGLPLYLFVLPWLWLVGAPWLTRASARNYWEASAFGLRFLAFLSCEGCLLLVLTFFLLLPYITVYWVLKSADTSTPERVVGWLFWIVVAGVVCLGGWRFYQTRRPAA